MTDEAADRFAQFVLMQSQNILYALGRIPGPGGEPGDPHFDIARILIDQLEMLQIKTKGNLNRQETELLENALSNMRLVFVESVNRAGRSPAAPAAPPPATDKDAGDEDDDRKRFSKSYG